MDPGCLSIKCCSLPDQTIIASVKELIVSVIYFSSPGYLQNLELRQ